MNNIFRIGICSVLLTLGTCFFFIWTKYPKEKMVLAIVPPGLVLESSQTPVKASTVNVDLSQPGETMTDAEKIDLLHLDWMDKSILPGQNFYSYANGTWQKKTIIPQEYSYSSEVALLSRKNNKAIQGIILKIIDDKSIKQGSIEQKIADFYLSGMDEKSINKLGVTPLDPYFHSIQDIHNQETLQSAIANLHKLGVDVLFRFGSAINNRMLHKKIAAILPSGLTFKRRDYLNQDNHSKQLRYFLRQHIIKMNMLLGESFSQASHESDIIIKIETLLASASEYDNSDNESFDVNIDSLEQIAPNFFWKKYINSLNVNLSNVKVINLSSTEYKSKPNAPYLRNYLMETDTFNTINYLKKLSHLLKKISINDWKIFLRWRILNEYSVYLSKPFVDLNLQLRSEYIGDLKAPSRWMYVINEENDKIGFAVGDVFTKKHISLETKMKILEMTYKIKRVFRKKILHSTWMKKSTKISALKKLSNLQVLIGSPDTILDYSKLLINRGPYVLNVIRSNQFLKQTDLNSIGKPVNRKEWFETPQVVNAYYFSATNSIYLMAGMLQPPFFNTKSGALDAVNYGYIGAVIAHEMMHAFDDINAKYDYNGDLKNWWSSQDYEKFENFVDCISKQYSRYQINSKLHINGDLVSTEAVADLEGLRIAYQAFHESKSYGKSKAIKQITQDQQFFIIFSHYHARKFNPKLSAYREEIEENESHAPGVFRVNGTLANMPEFQKAFNIPNDSPMVNQNRCDLW